MGVANFYNNIINGSAVYFGNSIGLSKSLNTLAPGTLPATGAFMSLDTTQIAPGCQVQQLTII